MWSFKQQIYKSSPGIPPYSYSVYSGSTLGTNATCSSYSNIRVTLYSHSAAMAIGSILYTSAGGIQAPYNGGGYDHFFPIEGIVVRINNLGIVTAISTCGSTIEQNVKLSIHPSQNTSLRVLVFVNGVLAYFDDGYRDSLITLPVGGLVSVRSIASNTLTGYVNIYAELMVTDNVATTLAEVRQSGSNSLTLQTTEFVMPDSAGVEILAFSASILI